MSNGAASTVSGLDAIVERVLERHRHEASRLLQVLCDVQEEWGFIPAEAASRIASDLKIPLARVESVGSFYSFLHLSPAGEYRVLFSDNITDRMLGSEALFQSMCQRMGVEPGAVSQDGLARVDTTSCTGMCDQGPALLVNGRAITRLDALRVREIGQLIHNRTPVAEWPADFFRVDDQIHRRGLLLDHSLAPGEAVRAGLGMGAAAIVDAIGASGLRGRGGAGFSTGTKWAASAGAGGGAKYVVCNADEGEPGTFKDRVLLSTCADLVFEGMTLAAMATGAQQGFVYLRGEYRYLRDPLLAALQRRRDANLLGSSILGERGFDFDIEIHMGAGAYVCGEETALIESLEGKRGVPRNRPPYPVTHGYLQRPTVLNNVETFCQAAMVIQLGVDRYRAIGTADSTGSKLMSVSGDCARPGIYEYPFGVTVREVLEDCGAVDTRAVQVGGPSGVCVPERDFDRKLAFEDLSTAGAFMVFDERRDIFEVARNFVHFFAHESCGFCTPCRVGTSMLKQTIDKIAAGHGTRHDLREVESLDRVLQTTSHCGLGRTACNPVLHTFQHFRPAYERRLKSLDFEPAFDLDGALARAREMTGRDDAGAHLKMEEP